MFKMIEHKVTIVTIAFFILCSIAMNVRQYFVIENLSSSPPSLPTDDGLVLLAERHWANKTNTDITTAMKERYAKVMYIGNTVCVSLENYVGGVGGVPVYCFDSKTHKLTKKLDDVE